MTPKSFNLSYWVSIFFRISSGLIGLFLVKILLTKISAYEFENYNLILSVFSLLPVIDLSYNGVRNFLTEVSVKKDYYKVYSILIPALKLNIILGFIMFFVSKILLFFFDLSGFNLIISLQIVVVNLKLITAYYQSMNEHFKAAFVDFSLNLSSLLVVFLTDKFATAEELFGKFLVLSIFVLIFFWVYLIFTEKINIYNTKLFSIKDIAVKGLQYSLTQVVLLIIVILVTFYFRKIEENYFDFVLANRFYLIILTFQSILITPYWSMINSSWVSKNYIVFNLLKTKYFNILLVTYTMLTMLFFMNEWLIQFFFHHILISDMNLKAFSLNVLNASLISLVLYFNSINKAREVQQVLFRLLCISIPIVLLLFFISDKFLLSSLIMFQSIFLALLFIKLYLTEKNDVV